MWTIAAIALVWMLVGRHLAWGGGCGHSRRLSPAELRHLREMRRERRWRQRHGWTEAHDAAWEGRTRRDAAVRAEDSVARLQRLWVGGRINDDEYEKGLDAVYASSLKLVH